MSGIVSTESRYKFVVKKDSAVVHYQDKEIGLQVSKNGLVHFDSTGGIVLPIPISSRIAIHKALVGRIYEGKVYDTKRQRRAAFKKTSTSIARKFKVVLDDLEKELKPEVSFLWRQLFRFYGPKKVPAQSSMITKLVADEYYLKDLSKYLCAAYILTDYRFSDPSYSIPSYSTPIVLKPCEWLKGLAHDSKIYPSLAKTIYGIRYPVPAYLLRILNQFKLPREFKNRTELFCYLLGTNHQNFYFHKHIIANTTFQDIKKALIIAKRSFPISKSGLGKFTNIHTLINWCCDFPEQLGPGASIVTLAKRSFEWHGAFRQAHTAPTVNVKLALPPIELPAISGVRLLTESQELVKESEEMHHCVSSYTSKAAEGRCYIFHVDFEGEKATVEISRDGGITQVKGPCNQTNAACHYARKEFLKSGWLEKLNPERIHGSSFHTLVDCDIF